MKDYISDYQGLIAKRSGTQFSWSNQVLKNILSNIGEAEFPTQWKDEQAIMGKYEETIMLKLVTKAKENDLDIVLII